RAERALTGTLQARLYDDRLCAGEAHVLLARCRANACITARPKSPSVHATSGLGSEVPRRPRRLEERRQASQAAGCVTTDKAIDLIAVGTTRERRPVTGGGLPWSRRDPCAGIRAWPCADVRSQCSRL